MRRRARLASWEDNATHGPRLRLHLDPGHCDCRDRAGGPLPIQPLPGDTQFVQTMPELGRPHRYMGAAPNPRILTGWFGASSHGLRFPPAGFPPVSRVPRPGSSPSSALFRFPIARRSRVPSLRPSLSGSVPVGFPQVSLPLSNLHVSAAARRICGRWSRAGATKVTSSRRNPWLRSPRSARTADVPRGSGSGGAARRAGLITACTQDLVTIQDPGGPSPEVFNVVFGQAREVQSTPSGDVGTVFSGQGIEMVWVSKLAEPIDQKLVLL